jgi:hypothetical protein
MQVFCLKWGSYEYCGWKIKHKKMQYASLTVMTIRAKTGGLFEDVRVNLSDPEA